MAWNGPAQRKQGVYCHEHWVTIGYPLVKSAYSYNVRDIFVEGTITETYTAQTNVEREVSYIFEVPPEASVTRFTAQVGTVRIESIVDEKSAANDKYQAAKNAGVQAWKLDKVNDEVFQISLGNAPPGVEIIISVVYVYVISSDTIEDSARLTIPMGMAARPGAAPASTTTVPTAPTGSNAVTITIGITTKENKQIFDLASLAHNATLTYGFSDSSFKAMTPKEKQQNFKNNRAYVEFTSTTFLKHHFVLIWTVPEIDIGRCMVEQLSPPMPNKPTTVAFALTMVSNIQLGAEEHEFIFLVDTSASMYGERIKTANAMVRGMLGKIQTDSKASFNIYTFNTSTASILPGGKPMGYDTVNAANASKLLKDSVSGGTDVNAALTTVLKQREPSRPRCSIIVLTDGLDWGVTAAMKTVQDNVTAAAAQGKLLRVFVMGLGDDVSKGMCEGLARAGSGATVYISESQLADKDHQDEKALTLVNTVNRAPIRVRDVKWGMNKATVTATGTGDNQSSRPKPNLSTLGAAGKGDNLPPPAAVQQFPALGTMFWGIRSTWYAIINGTFNELEATVTYDIPGVATGKTFKAQYQFADPGRLIHTLAARALIQGFEDKMSSITDSTAKYWNEAEIVRLGKTYSLASSQTSFVATMNGVGTQTNVNSNAPPASQSLLSSIPTANRSNLSFVNTQAPPLSSSGPSFGAPQMRMMNFISMPTGPGLSSSFAAAPSSGDDALTKVISAQDGNGSFDPSAVENSVFPDTSVPPAPACIAILSGLDNVKDQIWQAVCVIAFFEKKYADRESEWAEARENATKFVKTTLCCIFGVDSDARDNIFNIALDDASGYFY
ncbi:hypothetical protein TWF694_005403 [Orbilia ellipsospora]|uniref:Uncharacterized protein n=1 Tax=Orbilia ellipsospora TaxID=2528407 RepID=A0AAV9WUB5_9PEZI